MATPILTKNQQKKSVSGKKGPTRGLKNVLAQPHENYWPVLKNDDNGLELLLRRLLPAVKRIRPKVPWHELRKMTKAEQAVAKQQKNQANPDYDETAAKSIGFGVNKVTKQLEQNDTCIILLDANVDPPLLVKHVIAMAQNKNVPVLLISFLQRVTKDALGFMSLAIGLKKHVAESSENHFHPLFEKLTELSLELQSLKTPVRLFQDQTLADGEVSDEVCEQRMEEDSREVAKPCTVSTDVYLYRTSMKDRAFAPPISSEDHKSAHKTGSDFISLNEDTFVFDTKKVPSRFFESTIPDSNNQNNSSSEILYKTSEKVMGESDKTSVQSAGSKISYEPLKVKRLQGNALRLKATKSSKVKKKK